MENNQQFSLKWNNYLQHISGAFDSLRSNEDFVDVTLSCEGKKIKAHKMLLSACSNYFREIFKENQCTHPVIVFHNIKFEDLSGLVTFMYQGQVNVEQECLQSFLNTAELLEVQGLTTPTNKNIKMEDEEESVSDVSSGGGKMSSSPPAAKRKRTKTGEPVLSAVESQQQQHCAPESVDLPPGGAPISEPPGDDEEETPFFLHHENSLTQDNSDPYTDSQYYQPGKEEPPDINTSIDPTSGSSNDYQDSLQVSDDKKPLNERERERDRKKKYTCVLCDTSYMHMSNLYAHMKRHKGETECQVCHKVLSTRRGLKKHISNLHSLDDLII